MTRRIVLAVWLMVVSQVVLAEQTFATPEAALNTLEVAVEAGDKEKLFALFGPEYQAFVQTQLSEPGLARLRFQRFIDAFAPWCLKGKAVTP
jgi:hypothetical protein